MNGFQHDHWHVLRICIWCKQSFSSTGWRWLACVVKAFRDERPDRLTRKDPLWRPSCKSPSRASFRQGFWAGIQVLRFLDPGWKHAEDSKAAQSRGAAIVPPVAGAAALSRGPGGDWPLGAGLVSCPKCCQPSERAVWCYEGCCLWFAGSQGLVYAMVGC